MSATSIYDLHRASFSNVSAFVVMDGAERVATIAFKFPKDGAGRLFSYVHWIGTEMVRGFAAGGGYDKKTAACAAAATKMPGALSDGRYTAGTPHYTAQQHGRYIQFNAELRKDDGREWHNRLRDAGFTVLQAV